MTIGTKIAACRKRAGMSQEKLANELNISQPRAVLPLGNGEAVPDTEKVIQLSRIFHVTTDYLLLDIDEAPQSAAPGRKQQRNGTARRRKANEAPKHAHAFRLVPAHFRRHLAQCNARRRGSYAQTLTEWWTNLGRYGTALFDSWILALFIVSAALTLCGILILIREYIFIGKE